MDHDPELPLGQVLLIVLVQLLGYYIFRSANSQKDAFRRDPESDEVGLLVGWLVGLVYAVILSDFLLI